jgi:TrmH family RNA methyltransferase
MAELARNALIDRFRRARRDRELALLEGFHAFKHALRFDADLVEVLTSDRAELARLAAAHAPDLSERMDEVARDVDGEMLAQLTTRTPRTGVIAIARRPGSDLERVLEDDAPAPVALLEEPRDLSNVGACIRVAAAAGARAVIVTGRHDPWHPDAIRGSAGLHFALPVLHVPHTRTITGSAEPEPRHRRPLVALDPGGPPLQPAAIAPRAILAFGSERQGLSQELLERADVCAGIPMRPGVSSLNLATSVAAVLFSWRFSCPGADGAWQPDSGAQSAPD